MKNYDIGEDILDFPKQSNASEYTPDSAITKSNRMTLKQCNKSVRKSKIKSLIRQNSTKMKDHAKNMRKPMPTWIFIITVFSTILMGAQNLYLFIWQIKIPWVFLSSMCLRVIFFFASGVWFANNWKSYFKLCFLLDRLTTTGVVITISVCALCLITIPFARYPWLFQSALYVYPPFIITSMAYTRVLMLFCDWAPWKTILYKLMIVASAGCYIGLAMYFIFDPDKTLDFITEEVSDSFLAIVILYSYAGFDYHIETLSIIDETDGTTSFKGIYRLNCKPQNMECFLYGEQINTKIKKNQIQDSKDSSKIN